MAQKGENSHNNWHKAVRWLNIFANLANIGIVLHITLLLFPYIIPAAILIKGAHIVDQLSTIATFITTWTDPIIYFCKGVNRGTRLVGRNYHNVRFEEEKYGRHPWQNKADIVTTFLFGIAIAAFVISYFYLPFLATVAWLSGLIGIAVNIYFDETFPAKEAERRLRSIRHPEANREEVSEINEYYKNHYYESVFYSVLTFSLFIFLPVKSAASICSGHLAEALRGIAAVGSLLVVALNLARLFGNCFNLYNKLSGLTIPSEEEATISDEQGMSSTTYIKTYLPIKALSPAPPRPPSIELEHFATEPLFFVRSANSYSAYSHHAPPASAHLAGADNSELLERKEACHAASIDRSHTEQAPNRPHMWSGPRY